MYILILYEMILVLKLSHVFISHVFKSVKDIHGERKPV